MPQLSRKIEFLINGDWYVCTISGLNNGSTFHMSESSDNTGSIYVATSVQYIKNGIWAINTQPEWGNM